MAVLTYKNLGARPPLPRACASSEVHVAIQEWAK